MNPFIELYQDPVGTLAALGYALGLTTLLVITVAVCWSNAVTAYTQYDRNWHSWNYLPPAGWILRVAAVPGILAVDAWALSALIWLLTP